MVMVVLLPVLRVCCVLTVLRAFDGEMSFLEAMRTCMLGTKALLVSVMAAGSLRRRREVHAVLHGLHKCMRHTTTSSTSPAPSLEGKTTEKSVNSLVLILRTLNPILS